MEAKRLSGHAWAAILLLGFAGCGEAFKGSDNDAGEAGANVGPETGGAGGMQGGAAGTSGTSGAGTGAMAGQGGSSGTSAGTAGVGGAGAGTTSEGGSANTGEAGVAGANEAGGSSAGAGGVEIGPLPVVSDGLVLWLRADVGVSAGDDDRVSHWVDQSVNGFNVEQTGGEQQPKLVNSGGSLPSVEFDGVDDFMRIPAGFDDFHDGFSAFVVTSAHNLDACWAVLEFSNGSEIDDIFLGHYAASVHYEVLDVWMTQGEYPVGENLVLAVIHRPNEVIETRTNGSIAGEGSFPLPSVITRTQNLLGRSLYTACGVLDGSISEVLVYDRAVTSVELLAIEAYLATRFDCCSS